VPPSIAPVWVCAAVIDARAADGSWLARAVDVPRSRPVSFVHDPIGDLLASWPATHIAKLMVYAHPDDPAEVAHEQWLRLTEYVAASAATGRAVLVEFQAPAPAVADGDYLRGMLATAYARDIRPAWWKLPPIADGDAWRDAAAIISAADPTCEGMVVLGQDAGLDAVCAALSTAAAEPLVRGFAVGRAIFSDGVRRWLRDEIDDHALVGDVSERFVTVIDAWQHARRACGVAR
jgi:5-dehydro-2-deoxygluconokinase